MFYIFDLFFIYLLLQFFCFTIFNNYENEKKMQAFGTNLKLMLIQIF